MQPTAPGTSDRPAEPAIGAVARQLPPACSCLSPYSSVIAGSADVISFWGWAACSEGQEGGGKAGERFKVTCSCQLPR